MLFSGNSLPWYSFPHCVYEEKFAGNSYLLEFDLTWFKLFQGANDMRSSHAPIVMVSKDGKLGEKV